MIKLQTPLRLIIYYFFQKPYYRQLAITAFCVFLNKIINSLAPFIFGWCFRFVAAPSPHSFLYFPFIAVSLYTFTTFVSNFFGDIKDVVFVPIEQKVIERVSQDIFSHLQELGVQFHTQRKTGSLLRILERGTKGIETFFRFFVFLMFPSLLQMIFSCVFMAFFYPPFYPCVLFLTLFFYTAYSIYISTKRLKTMKKITLLDHATKAQSMDNLVNIMTVKIFHQEQQERIKYDGFLKKIRLFTIKQRIDLMGLNIGQTVILSLGLGTLLLRSTYAVQLGHMQSADFLIMNSMLAQFIMPLHALGYSYREVKQSIVDMQEMVNLWQLPVETSDEAQALPLRLERGGIQFKDVSFEYISGSPILKNCSFDIPGGSTAAFVGGSGAGKTTIFSLFMRFVDPVKGKVLIDGQDTCFLTRRSIRESMGLVTQDTFLFDDTVLRNIAYAKPEASLEEVKSAAQYAMLDDFIRRLPLGYETRVGERGVKFSGGEKQRLSIARLLLKNPPIMLFDEATSALDMITEAKIQKEINQFSKGKTTLMIAHRLSSVINADCIYVLSHGQIIEHGSHKELLAQDGLYAQLWQQAYTPA